MAVKIINNVICGTVTHRAAAQTMKVNRILNRNYVECKKI